MLTIAINAYWKFQTNKLIQSKVVAVLIFNHVQWFWSFLTSEPLSTNWLPWQQNLSLICEIPNFANAYLGKVTQVQGYGLFRFGVLCNLLICRWKTPPPPTTNTVKDRSMWFNRSGSTAMVLHREEFKYCMEVPEEECVLSFQLEKKRTFSLRRLRSDLLNPKFGNQKSALL